MSDNPPTPSFHSSAYLSRFIQQLPSFQNSPEDLANAGASLSMYHHRQQQRLPEQVGIGTNAPTASWEALQALYPTTGRPDSKITVRNNNPTVASDVNLRDMLQKSYNIISNQRQEIETLKRRLEVPNYIRDFEHFKGMFDKMHSIEEKEKIFNEKLKTLETEKQNALLTVERLNKVIVNLKMELEKVSGKQGKVPGEQMIKELAWEEEIKQLKSVIDQLKKRGFPNPEVNSLPVRIPNNVSQVDKMIQQTLARRAIQTPQETALESIHLMQFVENVKRYLDGIKRASPPAARREPETEEKEKKEKDGRLPAKRRRGDCQMPNLKRMKNSSCEITLDD